MFSGLTLQLILSYLCRLLYGEPPFVHGNLTIYGSEHHKNIFSEVIDITSEVLPLVKNEPITIIMIDFYDIRLLGIYVYYIDIIGISRLKTQIDLDLQKIFLHELFHKFGVGSHPIWFEYIKKYPHTPDLNHFNNTGDLMDQYYKSENKITNLTLMFMEHLGYKVEWSKRDGKFFNLS